ncbi:unnamed protein product [Adineta ricciae]|uniref:Uncharacterized protein n=1 Tax=Adineta ricciae TaxID=249248 RepID=A0A815URP7_ADIRI|nr:unnamed protein product [Adineta ricciae]CAF1517576.1 unnamed protein product [Adineta ricciae]
MDQHPINCFIIHIILNLILVAGYVNNRVQKFSFICLNATSTTISVGAIRLSNSSSMTTTNRISSIIRWL